MLKYRPNYPSLLLHRSRHSQSIHSQSPSPAAKVDAGSLHPRPAPANPSAAPATEARRRRLLPIAPPPSPPPSHCRQISRDRVNRISTPPPARARPRRCGFVPAAAASSPSRPRLSTALTVHPPL
uniref:Uncharacterized protein n=1 Tax=Oryza brachyantha TaxID=4533 RepID=J3LJT8_ORYBR